MFQNEHYMLCNGAINRSYFLFYQPTIWQSLIKQKNYLQNQNKDMYEKNNFSICRHYIAGNL